MKKYAVGDVVMVPMTVLAVHEQGFQFGLHANGGPNAHPDPHATAEEKAAALVERPATVIIGIPDGLEADAHGQIHFSAAVDL